MTCTTFAIPCRYGQVRRNAAGPSARDAQKARLAVLEQPYAETSLRDAADTEMPLIDRGRNGLRSVYRDCNWV